MNKNIPIAITIAILGIILVSSPSTNAEKLELSALKFQHKTNVDTFNSILGYFGIQLAHAEDEGDGGDSGGSKDKDKDDSKDKDNDKSNDQNSNTGMVSTEVESNTNDNDLKKIDVKTNDKSEKLKTNILPIDDKTKHKWKDKLKDISINSNLPKEVSDLGPGGSANEPIVTSDIEQPTNEKQPLSLVGGIKKSLGKLLHVKPLPGIANEPIGNDLVIISHNAPADLPPMDKSKIGKYCGIVGKCYDPISDNDRNNNDSSSKTSDKNNDKTSSSGDNNVQPNIPTTSQVEVEKCLNEFTVPVVSILISGCITPQNAVATDLASFEGNATVSFMGMEIPNVPVSNNTFATSLPTFIPVEYFSNDPSGITILENIQNSTNIGLDKITNIHMTFAIDQNTHESYNELTYCYKETANTEELCGTKTYVSEI